MLIPRVLVCEISYNAHLRTIFLRPCPVIRVFIHHNVRPIQSLYSKQALIVWNRLNSRVNVRSRLRAERRTVVTITHEQIIDGHPQSTLKLGSHSSSDMLAMMRREGRVGSWICPLGEQVELTTTGRLGITLCISSIQTCPTVISLVDLVSRRVISVP